MSTALPLIICQARTGSTRLASKVLMPLSGEPLLLRFIERVRRTTITNNIVVATTTDPSDDELVALCNDHHIDVYRGHPSDLLDRHYRCAREYEANVIVKIPSDCPLIDPQVIDRVVGTFLEKQDAIDYASNLHPPTYPDGNDIEVMSLDTLCQAWEFAVKPHEREHTTPWMWDGNPLVRCLNVTWESGMNLSMSHRWTIDYAEDYIFLKSVYDELYPTNPNFTLYDIIALLENHPEISEINRHLVGMNWYQHYMSELKTITPDQTRIARPFTS